MTVCLCGEDHDPPCPTCDKCGALVSTGAMALICPNREKCFFYPEEGIPEPFARMFGYSKASDGAEHGK